MSPSTFAKTVDRGIDHSRMSSDYNPISAASLEQKRIAKDIISNVPQGESLESDLEPSRFLTNPEDSLSNMNTPDTQQVIINPVKVASMSQSQIEQNFLGAPENWIEHNLENLAENVQ